MILKFIDLAIIILVYLSGVNFAFADSPQNSVICATYFTYIGCPNCAVTDPIVLTEWTKKYPNLVIIEYMWHGGDWQDPNSQFFGEFASAYKTRAAVPQLVFSKNSIRLGRIDVPRGENNIKALSSNPCPLINENVFWEDLDLNELEAKPKIWANGRILIKLNDREWLFQWNGEKVHEETIGDESLSNSLTKELLFTDNISKILKGKKFDIVEPQRADFSGSAFPGSEYVPCAEFENAIKIGIAESTTTTITQPVQTTTTTQPVQENQTVGEIELPFLGKIETEEFSLPVLTLLIALADGFNPCAFFVITVLLATLIVTGVSSMTEARKKILLVGGIFIFFSAFFYFLFMSALLNVFKWGQEILILTLFAGAIAVFAGIVNIKDYFYFQKGISLTLPKSQKERFIQRIKNLSLAESYWALIGSTVIIAATVNIYELLCTFGFPMVYTRILTLRELSSLEYYLYLIFYSLIYVIPLAIIVLIFAITLGGKTFSQLWVRRLKLSSGFMILFLGLVLMLNPKLLESVLTAFGILIAAIIISGIVILIDSLLQ